MLKTVWLFLNLLSNSTKPFFLYKSGKTNLGRFSCFEDSQSNQCKGNENTRPTSTLVKGSTGDGSIRQLFTKIYELFAEFAAMSFRMLDKILASPLMDLPFLMIDVWFSDAIMDLIFGIPKLLIEIPIALLQIPILVVKFPIVILEWIAS